MWTATARRCCPHGEQFLTYVNAGPFQPAIALGLDLGDDFYTAVAADLTVKRDHLVSGLLAAGFVTHVPEATYFTTVDIRPSIPAATAWRSAERCPVRCRCRRRAHGGVLRPSRAGRHLVRFACCKRLDVLDEAAQRLATLAS